MQYKVFLVEDEIVTREGIRDHVDWSGSGFEFCGEAPDGEIALPLLETTRPDVLITDIKMPFMDGLQLSKIVHERMPHVKIIILSGHDEFEYAQEAIKMGVTEYLLKPVSAQDLHNVLQKLAVRLDRERQEQQNLQKLQDQVKENQVALRERFLLKLVVGTISSAEAVEQSQLLGLELIAKYYLVIVIRIGLGSSERFDYRDYHQVQQTVSRVVEKNPDVFCIEKDLEELVLILKGNAPENVQEERDLILDLIERQMRETPYSLTIGAGTPKERITELYQSFVEALVNLQSASYETGPDFDDRVDKKELLEFDESAVENYLKCGAKEDFHGFFDRCIRPVGELALKSPVIKHYIFMNIVLATATFANELGGNIDLVIPDLNCIGPVLASVKTMDQMREQTQNILVSALMFRDNRAGHPYARIVQQAKQFIDLRYADPELSLHQVAAQVNLSPSHFSTIFSQETGKNFKAYVTELRISKAKELLRTTILRSFEIADRIGYSDPHYFSYVFRKITGLSPKEFRLQAQE